MGKGKQLAMQVAMETARLERLGLVVAKLGLGQELGLGKLVA